MAGKSAAEARSAAAAADAAAKEAAAKAAAADSRAGAVEAASRRLVYEVTLSEDQGNFRFGRAVLPDDAKSRIDEVISSLKSDPKGVYIEIEGHTDNVGSKEGNERLGMERAETVKRYIYETHQVPLHKINVISYGEDKPVAPNKTRTGRAQNRRVVIRVLS
jgi:outer membrane protein OmpA-like peptidoglycan-associated protein